jgi:hypothetical protein
MREREQEKRNIVFVILGMRHKASLRLNVTIDNKKKVYLFPSLAYVIEYQISIPMFKIFQVTHVNDIF